MIITGHDDPAVITFFNKVVTEAFETIKTKYLEDPTLSRARIYPSLAELLIYYDPKRNYKWFFTGFRLEKRLCGERAFTRTR